MKQKLYFLEYDDSCQGCPVFTGGKFFKDKVWTGDHEWDFDNPNPESYKITSDYSLKLDETFIDFDYSDHNYVSENFLKILDEFNIAYRSIPLQIHLSKKNTLRKKYFFLLLVGRVFLLDKTISQYKISKDPNNKNEYLYETYFPDEVCYEIIDKFYIKEIGNLPDFFICAELKKEICTEKFKEFCESIDTTGVKFTEIIDGFKYDPWDD